LELIGPQREAALKVEQKPAISNWQYQCRLRPANDRPAGVNGWAMPPKIYCCFFSSRSISSAQKAQPGCVQRGPLYHLYGRLRAAEL